MPIESRLGKKMDLTIDRLGINGEGVGQWYGYTIFVDGALPGEQVYASLYEKRKSFGRAYVVRRDTNSPHRAEPICPLFGTCGGCQLMHLTYSEQLVAKRQRVVDALVRIAKLPDVEIPPCIPSPSPLAYRNKIQLPVAPGQAHLRLGLYARNTHELVEMEQCHIHCSLGERAFKQIKDRLQASSITSYDPKTGKGELRHVLIKTAVFTQEILVTFVTTGAPSFELQEVARAIMQAMPEVKGVVLNINSSPDNTVLGHEYQVLCGEKSIKEKLCGLTFTVSSASFFQVNPPQAEHLYQTVLEKSALSGKETVLDAYCGVGTLSLLLAKGAKSVIGVECVSEAIADAKENARINDIANVEFICAEAESYIQTLSSIDVAILNPPRKGCEKSLLEKLATLKPERIVYVSCDPATLARDLHFLAEKGWEIESVQPFDMFPQTAHVESVATLSLKKIAL